MANSSLCVTPEGVERPPGYQIKMDGLLLWEVGGANTTGQDILFAQQVIFTLIAGCSVELQPL